MLSGAVSCTCVQVADQMVEAGMNLHGTRSVQKVIEVCRNTPSQVNFNFMRGEKWLELVIK